MYKVRVNNKFFRSLTEASKFLHLNKQWLSKELKNKQATTYKDLLVEKVEVYQNPKNKIPRKARRGIPVLVDGVAYDSCKAAERVIGCSAGSLSDAIRRRGKTVFMGYNVEPLYPSMVGKRKRSPKDSVKVLCKTTGITYNTIEEAAKVAGADSWTMSKKMTTAGGFIDKNGNEYVRLSPMVSKNTYEDTGKKLKSHRGFHTRKSQTVINDLPPMPVDELPKEIIEKDIQISSKKEIPQVVKDAINDKIIALLKEKGVYDDIMALLEYGGFTSVKFKKEND